MPVEMKELIAKATLTLLIDHHVKKLTVKDIVEQCHITRQAFYYHFEDIPELFRWMIEKKTDQMLQKALSQRNTEDGLCCFFTMATQMLPYIKCGIDSNYGMELERLLNQYLQYFFAQAVKAKNYYATCFSAENKFILRYHSHAVLGLLREWTERDSEHLDEIVHTVYCLMIEGISPLNKAE